MLTVLIETRNSEEALARTLGSLVSAAVEGVVRDVIVCDGGSTDQTRRVAEHAGCHLVTTGIASAIRQAKGEWLLILEPGARLAEGWIEPVLVHIGGQAAPARFRRATAGGTPLLTRIFPRRRPLSHGLLVPKGQAVSLSSRVESADAIARGLATRRLDAEIFAAPLRRS